MNLPIPYYCQICNANTNIVNDNSTQEDKKELEKSSTNYLWEIWNQRQMKIKGTNITLMGFSIAAFKTNFYLKELNIMFDGGLSSNFSPSHIFVTHLHSDHMSNCPWHFDPCKNNNVKFYVPEKCELRFYNFIEASHPFKGFNFLTNQKSEMSKAYDIVEVTDNSNLELEIKGKKYILEIIRCYHTVRCTSYGLIEKKQKLKKEFANLKGNEIKELKYKGVEITEIICDPFFCMLEIPQKKYY